MPYKFNDIIIDVIRITTKIIITYSYVLLRFKNRITCSVCCPSFTIL